MTSLRWLPEDIEGLCLSFVREAGQEKVAASFGAQEPSSPHAEPDARLPMPTVAIGSSGSWLFAVEANIPPHGVRAKVLRRLSAGGGEAVSIYGDLGKGNHDFGYACNGQLIASVTTSYPPAWGGKDPGGVRTLFENLTSDDTDMSHLEALMVIAETMFGCTLEQADLAADLPKIPILPILDDLPPDQPQHFGCGDSELDRLIRLVPPEKLAEVLLEQVNWLISVTGLDSDYVMRNAVNAALADGDQHVADDSPLGVTLRRLAWEGHAAQDELHAMVNRPSPLSEGELHRMAHRGYVSEVLRLVLAGRHRRALEWQIVLFAHKWRPQPHRWRERLVTRLR